MNTSEISTWREQNRIIVAVYRNEVEAKDTLERLMDMNCPMDMISVLGQVHASGDDTLGIYHLNVGDRIQAWGKYGAFWGGLWGVLLGAAGLFIIPGLGPVAAAGFIVETLVTGAAVGVSTIAGAAALSQLAIAFHRSGIADEKILTLHQAIQDGKYVLMLRGTELEVAQWREIFKLSNPLNIDDFPYAQITDKD
jgi:uncharacterized membrane protein